MTLFFGILRVVESSQRPTLCTVVTFDYAMNNLPLFAHSEQDHRRLPGGERYLPPPHEYLNAELQRGTRWRQIGENNEKDKSKFSILRSLIH